SFRPPAAPGVPPVGEFPGDRDHRHKRHAKAADGTLVDEGPAAIKRAHPRRTVKDTGLLASEQLREWRDRDLIERRDRLAHASGRGIGELRAVEDKAPSKRSPGGPRPAPVKKDKVEMTEPILIKDFSRETGGTVADIAKKLMA